MVRMDHGLVFAIRRAYRIGGRWYVKRDYEPDYGPQGPRRSYFKGPHYWMLTSRTRVEKFEEAQADMGDTYFTHGVWIPLTSRLVAEFVVRPD